MIHVSAMPGAISEEKRLKIVELIGSGLETARIAEAVCKLSILR